MSSLSLSPSLSRFLFSLLCFLCMLVCVRVSVCLCVSARVYNHHHKLSISPCRTLSCPAFPLPPPPQPSQATTPSFGMYPGVVWHLCVCVLLMAHRWLHDRLCSLSYWDPRCVSTAEFLWPTRSGAQNADQCWRDQLYGQTLKSAETLFF